MEDNSTITYKKGVAERIRLIMEIIELEIDGFAEFTQISKSHIYALLTAKKTLTPQTADKIGKCINLVGSHILKIDYPIPGSIRKVPAVKDFHETYKNNPEYFTKTKGKGSISYFFEHTLFSTTLFDSPVNVGEIKQACSDFGLELSSKKVSQVVNYLVIRKKLVKETRELKKLNGQVGTREVGYFSLKKTDKDKIE